MLKSTVTVDVAGFALVEKFAHAEYWKPEHSDLFSEDFYIDLPFAPPGMWQHMTHKESLYYFKWMSETLKDWAYTDDIKVFATDMADTYWVFRAGAGEAHWAKCVGTFTTEMVALVHVKGDKIDYVKEHMDGVAYYNAIGVTLPAFYYGDVPDYANFPPHSATPPRNLSDEELAKQIEKTMQFFIDPSFWLPEFGESRADNFIHELNFCPADMPRLYSGPSYEALNAWLDMHLPGGEVFDCVFYYTNDPKVYIAEYNCYFDVTWGGASEGGHYTNREISYIEINDDGLCTRLNEYFASFSKLSSIGVSIPSFPQFY